MRITTLALLGFTAAIASTTLQTAEAESPSSEPLIVRDCYGGMDNADGMLMRGASGTFGSGSGGGGLGKGAGPTPRRPTASAPAPARKAVVTKTREKRAEEAPRTRTASPMAAAEDEESMADLDAPAGDVLSFDANEQRERRPAGPRVDWGGETWLSNDDSMSLASAQRLLYALDRGASFSTSQIRPHELLNYFTFDTARPRGNQRFEVQPSAELVDGDTLSLALAVQGATPPRADLDLTVLVDRSGSMQAEGRMEYTKRALRHVADNLRNGDRFDLVLFDNTVCTPVENFTVGRDDPAVLYTAVERMQPRNSTDLDAGLKEAYRVATHHAKVPSRSQRVMVFTDAMLNTGDVTPHTVSEIGKALEEHDIRLTGVGVGRDFRDDVLDKLTEKGKGAYVFLGSERVVDRLFDRGFEALVSTIAHDVRFKLDLPPSLGLERFYGEESSTVKEDVQPVHFHAGNSQVFLQDLALKDGRVVKDDPIRLEISYDDPETGRRHTQTYTTTVGAAMAADGHNSRKGRALMAWTDILYAHAMGGDACGESFTDYRRAISGLQGDAEVAYISELVGKWCDFSEPVASWTAPAFLKVRLDSDIDITEIAMTCADGTHTKALSASDTVARFEATPGTCNLTLYGAVPMSTTVEVPATGADLRCVVRGGRLSCG